MSLNLKNEALSQFLERQVWPLVPTDVLGTTLTREDEDLILGYGVDGFSVFRYVGDDFSKTDITAV